MAERVAQVEEIFGEIENMCFLRTGEGMKSVMKTELTVVEAILQAGRCATAAPGAVFPFFFLPFPCPARVWRDVALHEALWFSQ